MVRTQIQLPDELYKRAKAFSTKRELSLAEMTRRGLEMFLDRFPDPAPEKTEWKLPSFEGGIKVPLEKLKDISFEDESMRSFKS